MREPIRFPRKLFASRGLTKEELDYLEQFQTVPDTVGTVVSDVGDQTTTINEITHNITVIQGQLDVVPLVPSPPEPAASTDYPGVMEIATQAEVDAGTDTERAVTPATLAGAALVATTNWVPLVDGAEPPALISDGAGSLIFVAYTP